MMFIPLDTAANCHRFLAAMIQERTPRARGLSIVLLAAALIGGPAAHAAEAFAQLDRTVETYGQLPAYSSEGQVTVTTSTTEGMVSQRWKTELVTGGTDGFRMRLRREHGEREVVIWRQADRFKVWNSADGSVRSVASAGSVLAEIFGPEALDAMIVPLLLAGETELTAAPEAVAFDGSEQCGEELCDVLALSQRGGRVLSRLWIEQRSRLVRRLELEFLPPTGPTSPAALVRKTLTVEHEPASTAPIVAEDLQFSPPAAPADDLGQSGGTAVSSTVSEGQIVVSEEISVALASLAVRALDSARRPIPDLEASNFEVTINGRELQVLSADWISSRGQGLELLEAPLEVPPTPLGPRDEANGNLVVLFIQADFNAVRVRGHLRILPLVREFLRALEPEDWVAVVSFDSHLKLWHDFSRDRDAVAEATDRAVRFGAMPPIRPGRLRSLAYTFSVQEARRAATPEDALRLTARSLLDIPGEKVLVYIGWGLGRYGSSGFRMTRDYDRTLATLEAARTSVFVLDVTDADYHTLELGIRQVAKDTGGTYSKTDKFARREVMALAETISGYYLLTLDRSQLPQEIRKLELRLKGRKGDVLLRDHQLGG